MTVPSGIIEHFPYLGLFILLILGGIGLPFPEDTTLILCGFLISHRIMEPVPAFIVVYAGILLADFLMYSIGRKYGRKIVTHKRFNRFLSQDRLTTLEERFARKGVIYILVGRHLVGLRAQIFLAAGVMRMPPLKFVMADAVSSVLTISLMVGAGYMGGNSLQVIRKDITRIEHVAVLLLVTSLATYIIFRYFKPASDKTE